MASLRLSFGTLVPEGSKALSVDGLLPEGPNLSHWPGNRTPPRWKADLSTGICLAFARAPVADRDSFLGGTELVANDHYDTDGFLSLLAVLQPELALSHEEICLAAAGAGDFQTLTSNRGFAIDRTVAGLAKATSPVAREFDGLHGPEKDLARYQWLLDHAESVLTDPSHFAALWQNELAELRLQLDDCRTGAASRRVVHSAALATVTSDRPLHRMALNTFAGAYRVLHIENSVDGRRYRYHDRTESWFEVATFCPPPRVSLETTRERLAELEPPRDDGAAWCCDPPTEPVPELYFGIPSTQVYGQVTRELCPSSLAEATVVEVLASELRLGH